VHQGQQQALDQAARLLAGKAAQQGDAAVPQRAGGARNGVRLDPDVRVQKQQQGVPRLAGELRARVLLAAPARRQRRAGYQAHALIALRTRAHAVGGVVRGLIVQHDQLQRYSAAGQHAVQCGIDVARFVPGGEQHRNRRQIPGKRCGFRQAPVVPKVAQVGQGRDCGADQTGCSQRQHELQSRSRCSAACSGW
jgi:hypothetical protein